MSADLGLQQRICCVEACSGLYQLAKLETVGYCSNTKCTAGARLGSNNTGTLVKKSDGNATQSVVLVEQRGYY